MMRFAHSGGVVIPEHPAPPIDMLQVASAEAVHHRIAHADVLRHCSERALNVDHRVRAAAPQAPEVASPATTAATATPDEPLDLASIPLPTSDESDELLRIRHSCAHIMAMAMQRVHRGTQVTVGPAIERGFFYDFDISAVEKPFTDKVMKKVQKEMRRIIRADLPFVREEVTAAEARQRIEKQTEPYKLQILDGIVERYDARDFTPTYTLQRLHTHTLQTAGSIAAPRIASHAHALCSDPDAPITIYHIGTDGEKEHWWDLCAGPHVERTGAIDPNAVELERTAGAYWRGDETQAQLTRVYGTAWSSERQLAAYRHMQEEAAKRDHRKLGRELQLFSLNVRPPPPPPPSGLVLMPYSFQRDRARRRW